MANMKIYDEILHSYKRCVEAGLTSSMTDPAIISRGNDLQIRLKKNMTLIVTFKNVVGNILKSLKGKYIFLLTDDEGYLLDTMCHEKILCHINFDCSIGISFTEEAIGTNAISMAMKLKRSVYLEPQYHYCDILKKWHCIAAPIIVDEKIIGYLDVSTIERDMTEEMNVVVELLSDKIANEYKNCLKNSELVNKNIDFTDKQIKILIMLAKGYKELTISRELGIKPVTVKYHKKKIIEKLCVKSIQEAIVKATKLNLIDID